MIKVHASGAELTFGLHMALHEIWQVQSAITSEFDIVQSAFVHTTYHINFN